MRWPVGRRHPALATQRSVTSAVARKRAAAAAALRREEQAAAAYLARVEAQERAQRRWRFWSRFTLAALSVTLLVSCQVESTLADRRAAREAAAQAARAPEDAWPGQLSADVASSGPGRTSTGSTSGGHGDGSSASQPSGGSPARATVPEPVVDPGSASPPRAAPAGIPDPTVTAVTDAPGTLEVSIFLRQHGMRINSADYAGAYEDFTPKLQEYVGSEAGWAASMAGIHWRTVVVLDVQTRDDGAYLATAEIKRIGDPTVNGECHVWTKTYTIKTVDPDPRLRIGWVEDVADPRPC
ncbi:hypothetical protein Cch01nite_26350 [Cellulomonas chitinilytica]|uniref:Uncharacterized protein n=1 Tax=Cellulomonas chitinilytica TaxID=398759 RepID=A0A919P1Z6_9CELL|nr:hypothetical protein [Cellulomonas chitinilytica]GIG21911.1 hypothetical protein Cch01nite_26350 [Cellulomonas chitinilytica]